MPDRLRGRPSSIQIAVIAGGPRLGDFEAGAVESVTSLEFSVILVPSHAFSAPWPSPAGARVRRVRGVEQ